MKTLAISAVLSLCLHYCTAQTNLDKTSNWLITHTDQLGGRAILMVYKDGKIIYSQAENKMSIKQKMITKLVARRQGKTADLEDYTAESRQLVASCSKWLSAALVMTFVDQGTLKLSDSVGKFLPLLSAKGKGSITVGQCLSHLTGIKAPPLKENLEEMKHLNTMDEAITAIADLPMEGKPGKTFHYSNTGLQIAGAILEKISGKSFENLFAERIAKPLNMRNTDFGKGKLALPAGGAISSPEDYMNFLVMLLNGGTFNGKRVLTQESVTEMQINRITADVKIAYSPAETSGSGYGYGEWVRKDPSPATAGLTISSPGLFGSFPWLDNNRKYAAFLMTFNLKSEGRQEMYGELKRLVDEAVTK